MRFFPEAHTNSYMPSRGDKKQKQADIGREFGEIKKHAGLYSFVLFRTSKGEERNLLNQ
jgi:hypothetical protein